MFLAAEDLQLCCDVDQIITMVDGFALTAPFSRCPTCTKNMIAHICQFSCSPNQDGFIFDPVLSEENGNLKDQRKNLDTQTKTNGCFMLQFSFSIHIRTECSS